MQQISPDPKHKAIGWVVIGIVVVAVVITFFALRRAAPEKTSENNSLINVPAGDAASTSVGAIEHGLNSLQLDNLDTELSSIDAELKK